MLLWHLSVGACVFSPCQQDTERLTVSPPLVSAAPRGSFANSLIWLAEWRLMRLMTAEPNEMYRELMKEALSRCACVIITLHTSTILHKSVFGQTEFWRLEFPFFPHFFLKHNSLFNHALSSPDVFSSFPSSSDLPYVTGYQSSSNSLGHYNFYNVPRDHGTRCSKGQWISSLSVVAYAFLSRNVGLSPHSTWISTVITRHSTTWIRRQALAINVPPVASRQWQS